MQQAEKRGEPTLYNIMRSDIDSAVRQSMTDIQFYRRLSDMGYIVNDDPNRKYATIRTPGMNHNVRFKTLGESYTPKAIVNRILENRYPGMPQPVQARQITATHYRLRGSYKSAYKHTGLYAQYLYYCYRLSALQKNRRSPQKPLTPEVRAAVRQMRKYSEQTRMLCHHRIETVDQLKVFIDDRKRDLGELEQQRGKVYNRMRSAKTPETLQTLKSERDELSCKIKSVRRELYLANDVMNRSMDVKRQIRAELEMKAERFGKNQPKHKFQQKERGEIR
jgi:hypothetical protein